MTYSSSDFTLDSHPVSAWAQGPLTCGLWQYGRSALVPDVVEWTELCAAYPVLLECQSRYLGALTTKLNSVHGECHTDRYWNIHLGFWLHHFIQLVWNRMTVLLKAKDSSLSLQSECTNQMRALSDTQSYMSASKTDWWNALILSDIADFLECTVRVRGIDPSAYVQKPARPMRNEHPKSSRPLQLHIDRILNLARGNRRLEVLVDSMQPEARKRFLRSLGQPRWQVRLPPAPSAASSPNWRTWTVNLQPNHLLEDLLNTLIPAYLPTCFLEGWREHGTVIKRAALGTPKNIVVDMRHYADVSVSRWIADCVESGSRLLVWQHGGSYGSAPLHTPRDHDLAVADLFLSWGWSLDSNSHVIPFATTKPPSHEINLASSIRGSEILVAIHDLDRYPTWIGSGPSGSQELRMLTSLRRLLMALPDNLRSNVRLRFASNKNGWHIPEIIMSEFPDVGVSDYRIPYPQALGSARFAVHTADATTLVESLLHNIPTLLLVDQAVMHFTPSAAAAVDVMRRNQMAFDDPDDLAAQIRDTWDRSAGWWQSEAVLACRQNYLETYGRLGPDPAMQLARILSS